MTPFHLIGYRDEACSICRESLNDHFEAESKGGIVAHGLNHQCPGHKNCLRKALKVNNLCPICRIPMDMNSLFTWKERSVKTLKPIIIDICNGAALGGSVSLAAFVAALVFGSLASISVNPSLLGRTSNMEPIGTIKIIAFIVTVIIGQTGLEIVEAGITGGIALSVFSRLMQKRGIPNF